LFTPKNVGLVEDVKCFADRLQGKALCEAEVFRQAHIERIKGIVKANVGRNQQQERAILSAVLVMAALSSLPV
jgi:hypothetical protein